MRGIELNAQVLRPPAYIRKLKQIFRKRQALRIGQSWRKIITIIPSHPVHPVNPVLKVFCIYVFFAFSGVKFFAFYG